MPEALRFITTQYLTDYQHILSGLELIKIITAALGLAGDLASLDKVR